MVAQHAPRTAHVTSRLMDYFTEPELEKQIGHQRPFWPLALLKELIDNSLDACETTDRAPEIAVTVEPDCFSVADNGPGIPAVTIRQSADYAVRVSSKRYYVGPTRGQLGNALKCLWAAPFVATGMGHVIVEAQEERHTISVGTNQLRGEPEVALTGECAPEVKIGSQLSIAWQDSASLLRGRYYSDSYLRLLSAKSLLADYALVNPHATFTVSMLDDAAHIYPATDTAYPKWRPDAPPPPHWYSVESLADLIRADLRSDAAAASRTVSAFVGGFAGLSGTAKRKAVTDAAGLTGKSLADLVRGDDIDRDTLARLYMAMCANGRRIQPTAFTPLGEAHVRASFTRHYDVIEETFRYKKVAGEAAPACRSCSKSRSGNMTMIPTRGCASSMRSTGRHCCAPTSPDTSPTSVRSRGIASSSSHTSSCRVPHSSMRGKPPPPSGATSTGRSENRLASSARSGSRTNGGRSVVAVQTCARHSASSAHRGCRSRTRHTVSCQQRTRRRVTAGDCLPMPARSCMRHVRRFCG